MHGRLKVKTSAEKQAEKEKERQKKKLVYQACMTKIRQMYCSGDRSVELLELITKILENIPEFSTLWNWRRVALLDLFERCNESVIRDKEQVDIGQTGDRQHEQSDTDDNKSNVDCKEPDNESATANDAKSPTTNDAKPPTKSELIASEKRIVARCLEVNNPKAYSLWSHRRWLVQQDPSESVLEEELQLCNLFLKYDERNFHCWDYRRFLVKLGKIPSSSELDKSTSLIEQNFSNYSAWHYRSTLLDTTDKDVVDAELEWTQNAYFTDPADQSVWLYHQWLLGREKVTDSLLAVQRDRDNSQLIVLLSVTSYSPPNLTVSPATELRWTSNECPSRIWYTDCTLTDSDITVSYNNTSITLPSGTELGTMCNSTITPRVGYTAPLEVARDQLANIRELYELEPDNKWVILTLVNMLNTLNTSKTKEQITEIRNLTVKLCQVDNMRTGYYRDMWSTVLCETAVTAWWTSRTDTEPLNLSKKYLTRLLHTDFMFTLRELDLSHNNLTNLLGFGSLILLKKLDISHNKLSSLEGLEHCKNLAELDASHNIIHNSCGILPCTKCRIQTLRLEGNPLCRSEVYPGCVLESFVMLCVLDQRVL